MTRIDITRHAIVFTFCGVMVAVFGTMLIGLFDPRVNNADIFKLITHAFDLVLVALTSYLAGNAQVRKDP